MPVSQNIQTGALNTNRMMPDILIYTLLKDIFFSRIILIIGGLHV